MTYEYLCEECGVLTDIIKSVSDLDRVETCAYCSKHLARQFSPHVHFIGTSVQSAEYNYGLGFVVKNKRHREELAKQKGLIEVGSDYGTSEKMQKSFDTERAHKFAKRWEDD